jgi:H+/Cl- antiporter ClcA
MYDFSIEDKQLLVLTGMAGAMGALFPTPVLAVLIIHELGNPPRYTYLLHYNIAYYLIIH